MDDGEKRLHPRLIVRQTGIRNGLLVGRVLNLSLTGLALESSTGLRTGSRHAFQLELGERRFRIDAEVRWCRLTRTVGRGAGEFVPVFHAGLAFDRPLRIFPERGRRNNGACLDPEFRF
jgi:hypothetical protein